MILQKSINLNLLAKFLFCSFHYLFASPWPQGEVLWIFWAFVWDVLNGIESGSNKRNLIPWKFHASISFSYFFLSNFHFNIFVYCLQWWGQKWLEQNSLKYFSMFRFNSIETFQRCLKLGRLRGFHWMFSCESIWETRLSSESCFRFDETRDKLMGLSAHHYSEEVTTLKPCW